MQFLWHAQPGHSRSFGMYVIDPAGNPTEEESYILRVPLHELKQGIDDEEILARFSKGFFAGWIFGPERWIAPFVQGIIDHEGMLSTFRLSKNGGRRTVLKEGSIF